MTAQPTLPPADPAAPPARRLHRSRSQRVLAGVCGGLAEEFGADPALLRLLAVVLWILTGIVPLLLLYLVAAVIIPEGDPVAGSGTSAVATGNGAGTFGVIVGGILVLLGLSAFAQQVLNVDWDMLWPLGLIAMGTVVILLAFQRQSNR